MSSAYRQMKDSDNIVDLGHSLIYHSDRIEEMWEMLSSEVDECRAEESSTVGANNGCDVCITKVLDKRVCRMKQIVDEMYPLFGERLPDAHSTL